MSGATRIVFTGGNACAEGQVHVAAFMPNNAGLPRDEMRVLGRYSLSYLLDGSGEYRDSAGHSFRVESGDCLLILPELGRSFGPGPDEHWSCFYLHFSGPVFDSWRRQKLLDDSRLLLHLKPIDQWLAKMTAVYAPAVAPSGETVAPSGALLVARALALLAEIELFGSVPAEDEERPWWLWQAQHILEQNIGQPLRIQTVAADLKVPLETFRKQFRAQTGLAPMQYRLQKRLDAARSLLENSGLTGKDIAQQLGFTDEAHFSRLFSKHCGVSPREFRKANPRRTAR